MVTAPVTSTLEVPGAILTYDVRPAASLAAPPLLLTAQPTGAAGLAALAAHLTDRTVVTYDPRGVGRSRRTDIHLATPYVHADDLHRLARTLGLGQVDLFAGSAGAVDALAWVARHPEDLRAVVVHEPPVVTVLPDRDVLLRATAAVHETYCRSGREAATAQLLPLLAHRGPLPHDYLDHPGPDPAGPPAEDDGSRDDLMLAESILTATRFRPDVGALRDADVRVVVAVGRASEGQVAHRGGLAVAELLGLRPEPFPGGNDGFAGGEQGRTGEPEAFAKHLREVLAG